MNFVGIRVAAVSADQKTFLGYGTYLGDFLNPGLAEYYVEAIKRHPEIPEGEKEPLIAKVRAGESPFGINPKIRLDDGREVWGAECWWGAADAFVVNGYAKKYGAPEIY